MEHGSSDGGAHSGSMAFTGSLQSGAPGVTGVVAACEGAEDMAITFGAGATESTIRAVMANAQNRETTVERRRRRPPLADGAWNTGGRPPSSTRPGVPAITVLPRIHKDLAGPGVTLRPVRLVIPDAIVEAARAGCYPHVEGGRGRRLTVRGSLGHYRANQTHRRDRGPHGCLRPGCPSWTRWLPLPEPGPANRANGTCCCDDPRQHGFRGDHSNRT